MRINDDLSRPVIVHAAKLDWVPSPSRGVDRRMLFRIGEEKARATSIVRYAPHSRFPHHSHPGGEEFFVLEGTFQDETGDFPAGSYVRNPPGTGHAPGSDEGCTIFVKLWQFRDDDRERIARLPGEGKRVEPSQGTLSSVTLFESPYERVGIEEWQPGAAIELSNPRGLEVLVLSGSFSDEQEGFERLSWLRLPAGKDFRAQVDRNGARIWFKSARLLQDRACEF
jgi:anti-sigma factor ChrR (cupin superfamily)